MNEAFYTDPKLNIEEEGNLRNYVNNLDKKINYAKWKQDLILKYNYLPLKNISDKIQTERIAYEKIIKQQEDRCIKILQGKDLTEQLQVFSQFSQKLQQKINDIQVLINKQKMNKRLLEAQANDIKRQLQAVNKDNKIMTVNKLNEQGIFTKRDIARLVKSKTTNYLPNVGYKSQKKYSPAQAFTITQFNRRQSRQVLFNQCLKKVITEIRTLNSSDDVQTGIYLDVMGKKSPNKTLKFSKSTICDTLINRFSEKAKIKVKGQEYVTDFEISWQSFKKMNWKQIMGIIMVKDRECSKIKNLLFSPQTQQ